MADAGLLRAWWQRWRGRLQPRPFPYADAAILASPLRGMFASPSRILGAFGLGGGERVLEIGPGIGYYSCEAAARVGESGRLVCLDVQRDMLLATRRSLAARHQTAAFVEASAVVLPFRSGAFDRVLLITALGEIPERSGALREIHRILRPGGTVCVSEQLPDPDFVTPATLRAEMRAAGFVEDVTTRHLAIAYTSTWRR